MDEMSLHRRRELSGLGEQLRVREVTPCQEHLPVVGDFAGPKALRAAGDYLTARRVPVAAFYISDVELRTPEQRSDFCANVGRLPVDSSSVFVRNGSSGIVLLSITGQGNPCG
jgi:hypothetical protein